MSVQETLLRRQLRHLNFRSAFFLVAVVLSVFGATLLMLFTLHLPYWFDEANTVRHILKGFPAFFIYIGSDNQMPLYYLALRMWAALFGTSFAATALLSLVFNIFAAGATYLLAARLFRSRRIAVTAAALYWCSYASIYFATETRMYSLLSALVATSTLQLWNVIQRGRRVDLSWYWVASFAGVMTHYLYWIVVFSQNVILLLFYRRLAVDFRKWVIGQLLLFAAFLPWLPFFWQRFSTLYLSGFSSWLDFAPPPTWSRLVWNLWGLLAPLPQPISWFNRVILVATAAALIGLLVQFRAGRWFLELNVQKLAGSGGFILIACTFPFAILMGLNFVYLRYLAYLTPLLACAMAAGLQRSLPPQARTFLLIAVLVNVVSVNIQVIATDPRNYNRYYWPSVASQIEQQETATPSALIFLTAAEEEILFRSYYRGRLPVTSLLPHTRQSDSDRELSVVKSIGIQYINEQNVEEIAEQIGDQQTVWVLFTDWTPGADPKGWQKKWFTEHCQLIHEYRFYASDPRWQLSRFAGCRSGPVPSRGA